MGVDDRELMIQRERRQAAEDRRRAKTREDRDDLVKTWSCVRNVGGRLRTGYVMHSGGYCRRVKERANHMAATRWPRAGAGASSGSELGVKQTRRRDEPTSQCLTPSLEYAVAFCLMTPIQRGIDVISTSTAAGGQLKRKGCNLLLDIIPYHV